MNASVLWEIIKSKASSSEFETKTIPQVKGIPLWFLVGIEGDTLLIKKAKVNSPSVKITAEQTKKGEDMMEEFDSIASKIESDLADKLGNERLQSIRQSLIELMPII